MRESVIITSLIGSFVIFSLSVDLFSTLFMFVLFGILPGQSQPLSASSMLSVYSFAAGTVSLYVLRGGITALLQVFAGRGSARRQPTSAS